MSQIKSISIEGFKSIASIKDLELRPLNVLIGANGSGKSNFLAAFAVLRNAIVNRDFFHEFVERSGGADRFLHYGSKTTPAMRFKIGFHDEVASLEIQMRHGVSDKLYPNISIDNRKIPPEFVANLIPNPGMAPAMEFLKDRLGGWSRYHFLDTTDSSPLKRMANVHDNRRLREDGSNLCSFCIYFGRNILPNTPAYGTRYNLQRHFSIISTWNH